MSRVLAISRAACVCLLAAALLASPALAGSPTQDKLTGAELKALSSTESALTATLGGKKPNWKAALAACGKLGSSTSLLASQQTDCAASVSLIEAFLDFPMAFGKCGGTTVQKYTCAEPLYDQIERAAVDYYSSEKQSRAQALDRGFSGVCLKTLAPTTAELAQEQQFAAESGTLDGYVRLIVKVGRHQAPSSELNLPQVLKAVAKFEHLGDVVIEGNRPSNFTACPH